MEAPRAQINSRKQAPPRSDHPALIMQQHAGYGDYPQAAPLAPARSLVSRPLSPSSLFLSFLDRRREGSFLQVSPDIRGALCRRTDQVLRWMKRGGRWRALLVSTVGIVVLLGLLGLGSFMLFFLAITVNAVAIGFLASIASIGAFTAVFFTSLTAIYVGALIAAVISVSTTTFFCISAILMAIVWIVCIWIIWRVLRKCVEITKAMAVPAIRMASDPRQFKQIHNY